MVYLIFTSTSNPMTCRYGERGALTAICTNATPNYFREAVYRFDHLDEMLQCLNCSLTDLEPFTFDISGNQIKILDLRNSKIESISEKAFIGLVFMEKLILSDNLIAKLTPGAFYGARKIKKIYLNNALAAPLQSLAFHDLPQLKELYMQHNDLTILESKTFFGLDSLEILDLSFNKLSEINNTLTYLKNLKLLILNNNEITNIVFSDFQGLNNLLEIDLATNLIGTLEFNLSESNSLRKLDLSNNLLNNEVVKVGTFKNMHNLELLNLAFNLFKIIPPKLFMGLYNLRELILSNNSITKFESGAFSGLPSLRVINVSHNYIETAEITGNLLLIQLHVIDFSDNKIANFNVVKFLQRAPRISKIDLTDNLMSCESRRKEEEYFKNESITVKLDVQNCPKLSEDALKQLYEDLENQMKSIEDGSSVITVFKFLLLALVISLVGLLFYIHFFILNRKG